MGSKNAPTNPPSLGASLKKLLSPPFGLVSLVRGGVGKMALEAPLGLDPFDHSAGM